jgi:hypothetical protein
VRDPSCKRHAYKTPLDFSFRRFFLLRESRESTQAGRSDNLRRRKAGDDRLRKAIFWRLAAVNSPSLEHRLRIRRRPRLKKTHLQTIATAYEP